MSEPAAAALPRLLQQALTQITASYQAFLATEPGLEAKVFKEYHAAGRACLAHLDLVQRLSRGADPAAPAEADLSRQLIDQARQALSRQRAAYPPDETETEDDQ